MYGNKATTGLSTDNIGLNQPDGIDPDDLTAEDRTQLRQFASDIATEAEEHLPNMYSVNRAFQTGFDVVSLNIQITSPVGNLVQCQIHPTIPDESAKNPQNNSLVNGSAHEMTDETVVDIGQQLAAAAIYQTMQIAEQHDQGAFIAQ